MTKSTVSKKSFVGKYLHCTVDWEDIKITFYNDEI